MSILKLQNKTVLEFDLDKGLFNVINEPLLPISLRNAVEIITYSKLETPTFTSKLLQDILNTDTYKKAFEAQNNEKNIYNSLQILNEVNIVIFLTGDTHGTLDIDKFLKKIGVTNRN